MGTCVQTIPLDMAKVGIVEKLKFHLEKGGKYNKNIRHNTSMAICSAFIGAMCCCLGDFYAKGNYLHSVEEDANRDVCGILGAAPLLHDYL